MGIIALNAVTMIDDDQISVASGWSGECNDTASSGIDFAAILDTNINAVMIFFAMYGTNPMPPWRVDLGTADWPIERMVRCRGRSSKDILRRRLIRAGRLIRIGRSCRYG